MDKLKLIAGVLIPVPAFGTEIKQPTIKQIALIGEREFYETLSYFSITKEKMIKTMSNSPEEEEMVRKELLYKSDFQIILEVVSSEPSMKLGFANLLLLLFPRVNKVDIQESFILLSGHEGYQLLVDDTKFAILKEIVDEIFCLKETSKSQYNPANNEAAKIAAKLEERHRRLAQQKGETGKEVSLLANYVSILSTGSNGLTLPESLNLTVYQLFNQMRRFGLYSQYQQQIQVASFHGGKDIEFVDWFEQL